MGRPKKSDRSPDTRDALLRAAEREFGALGYTRARLEDIAEAAGIRRSSLLYHFGSKAGLYAEVVASIAAEVRAMLDAAIAAASTPAERIEAVATTLLGFSEQRRSAISMFVRELLDNSPPEADHLDEFVSLLDSLEERVRADAANLVPPGAPIRAALLHIITSQALRVAAGERGQRLWGDDVDPRVFVRALMSYHGGDR